MSDFDPGPGWRLVDGLVVEPYERRLTEFDSKGQAGRSWIREKPVPPLPTEPYAVIRAWWRTEMNTVLTLDEEHVWRSHLSSAYDAEDLAQMVRFEVLAEPRAVTAKAVLQPLFDALEGDGKVPGRFLSELAQQFGVSDV